MELRAQGVLGQLGQDGHAGLPQGDVGEAQVPHLVLSVAVSVHDVDVTPACSLALPPGAAQVDQKLLRRLLALLGGRLLRVGVLAAVAGAGGLVTLLRPVVTLVTRSAPLPPPVTAALRMSPATQYSQYSSIHYSTAVQYNSTVQYSKVLHYSTIQQFLVSWTRTSHKI